MEKNRVDDFLYEQESYQIRGACFKVYNTLGFGHKESVYQKALTAEFKKTGLNFETEKTLSVLYDNKKVGTYKPDFIIEKKIIIEIKAVPFMPKNYEDQLIYYLKGTNYKLGLINSEGIKVLRAKRAGSYKFW